MTKSSISQELVRKMFNYDPETGVFIWAWHWNPSQQYRVGSKAGTMGGGKGYLRISIDGKNYLAHLLAWLYVHGVYPAYLDHENGVRSDNKLSNLRLANRSINRRNCCRPKDNTTGRIGVYKTKEGTWRATITVNYVFEHLGCFEKFEDACAARAEAEKRHGFHPNHGRISQGLP